MWRDIGETVIRDREESCWEVIEGKIVKREKQRLRMGFSAW